MRRGKEVEGEEGWRDGEVRERNKRKREGFGNEKEDRKGE